MLIKEDKEVYAMNEEKKDEYLESVKCGEGNLHPGCICHILRYVERVWAICQQIGPSHSQKEEGDVLWCSKACKNEDKIRYAKNNPYRSSWVQKK